MTSTQLSSSHIEILNALTTTQQKIADLQEVADHLKAQLVAAIGDADTATNANGEPLFTYRPRRSFDLQRATALLDADTLARCASVDPKKVKSALTGDQLDECMTESGRALRVLA